MKRKFTFRLSKAEQAHFWKSVRTADVKESILSEQHGRYNIEFYPIGDAFCIGISHPVLLPNANKMEILRFTFSPIGDGLRVVGEYSDFPVYRPYLASLFREIGKDWKDAQPDLQRAITELMELPPLAIESELFEDSDFDLSYHEHTTKATLDAIAAFIGWLVKNNFQWRLTDVGRLEFEASPFENKKISISALSIDTEEQEYWGEVIQFELTPIGDETIIQATCVNVFLVDYFESLWKRILAKYPPTDPIPARNQEPTVKGGQVTKQEPDAPPALNVLVSETISGKDVIRESPSEVRKLPARLTPRHESLNRLAIMWAELNQAGKEKEYNIDEFLRENCGEVGLYQVGTREFEKHLVKAYSWGVIDKSEKGRYIPKIGN